MAVDSASSKERQRRLQSRLDALLDRIQVLERKQPVHIRADLLHQRQESCFERIAALERSAGIAEPGDGTEVTRHPAAARTSVPAQADDGSYVPRAPPSAAPPLDPSASPTQARLHEELVRKGITNFRFVRAPPQYYSATLQFRMGVLKAASIYHLCKSIVMENTRAHSSVRGIEDPRNSKYYLVLVQYAARLNADKLRNHIHKWNEGRTSKKYFNMRLCPEAVSDELTGFSHNGVSPVGLQTPLPMILSDRITQLQPDFFWIGGGEVDLKLGLSAQDFVRAYNPYVLDCTHDDDDGDAATGLESAAP